MAKRGEFLSRMLLLATRAHFGQFDKGGRPYILHPLAVMHKLRTDDEELQCIALGHDVIEDGKIDGVKVTYGRLRDEGFTPRVIEGIRCLTKVPGESEEENQEKILGNMDACRVKQRDLEHNGDFRRLKGVEEKDGVRMVKYMKLHARIVARITAHRNEQEAAVAQMMQQRQQAETQQS